MRGAGSANQLCYQLSQCWNVYAIAIEALFSCGIFCVLPLPRLLVSTKHGGRRDFALKSLTRSHGACAGSDVSLAVCQTLGQC